LEQFTIEKARFMTSWLDSELEECRFADARLGKRFRALPERLSKRIGETIPMACQDWASTKAAYRFFSNQRVCEREILAGHFQATRACFRATEGWVLVLRDTTEFSFQREDPSAIGVTYKVNSGKDPVGRPRMHTVCGLLMHSSLVVTTEGLPLGIAAVKFWTRKKFKGSNALKKKIYPTRVPIEEKESIRWLENPKQATMLLNEPERCVHIGTEKATSMSSSAPRRKLKPISWYAPAWIVWPKMESTPFRRKWTRRH
jgi:hypothetical protein